jgi:hypothetical protein
VSGDHLRADLGEIGEVSARVADLAGRFDATTQLSAGYAGDFGSAQLASAFSSFACGWSRHRAALIADLRSVAEDAARSVQAYRHTDGELAADLRDAAGRGHAGREARA